MSAKTKWLPGIIALCCVAELVTYKGAEGDAAIRVHHLGAGQLFKWNGDQVKSLDQVRWHVDRPILPGNPHVKEAMTPDLINTASTVSANTNIPTTKISLANDLSIEITPDNRFFCLPCVCSKNKTNFVIANCTSRYLTDFPPELPNSINSIDMSGNDITYLNFNGILPYASLTKITLTCNRNLNRIANTSSTLIKSSVLQTLDLSSNSIGVIETEAFVIFPMLRDLILRGNKLPQITNQTFFGLQNLQSLDLSENKIAHIEIGAFEHFTKLRYLDLSCNPRVGLSTEKLPPALFRPLANLWILVLHGVKLKQDSVYPNETFAQLPRLEELTVDGLDTEFGPEFKSLTNLHHLEIGSVRGCDRKNISSTFFENIPFLLLFSMTQCNLEYVDSTAYSKLKNLYELKLAFLPKYSLATALVDMRGLQTPSLRVLILMHLFDNNETCQVLRGNQSKYLTNLKLILLDLSDNLLVYIEEEFIQRLPATLKNLIMRQNRFTTDRMPLTLFGALRSLVCLDVSYQNRNVEKKSIKKNVCFKDQLSENLSSKHGLFCRKFYPRIHETLHHRTGDMAIEQSNCDTKPYHEGDDSHLNNWNEQNELPPKLKLIQASHFMGFGLKIFQADFQSNSSLAHIDLSNTFLTTSIAEEMKIPESCTKVELGENYVDKLNDLFFPQKNKVLYVDLHDNLLGPIIASDINGTMFKNLQNVKYMDLGKNLISNIPKTFFRGLVKLETLRLSENNLQSLNSSFSGLNNLNSIDLRDNSVAWISKDVRDDLDEIASLHDLSIDLTNNPLPCTCNMLDVLHWMEGTKVVFLNRDILICRFDDGSEEHIGDFKVRLRALQRRCATKSFIIVTCVASMAVVGIFFGFALLYRFRWRLRYFRYIVMAEFGGFKPKTISENGFKFDAYILYTEETRKFVIRDCVRELEEKRGHNLCFEDRNFMPGSPIVSDIVSAVNNSHKTVPVVTPEFYDGDFSEYGVKMAVMEEIFKKRLALHLCIYQPTPSEMMSHDFLVAMKRNDYTEFPDDKDASEEIVQNFWDRLSRAIGHNQIQV